MKHQIALAFVLCAVCAAGTTSSFAQTKTATSEDAVLRADRAVTGAFETGDKATINKYLDNDFSWIDTDGVMWAREDALRAGLKPLVGNGPDVKFTELKYGSKVVWIQHNEGNKFAAHFWVQRPSGWRLLHTNEIAVRPASEGVMVRPKYEVPCINPCKEIPFKPLSASEK